MGLLFLVSSTLSASPLYPWDLYKCSELKQDDGKKIGAVCSNSDYEQQVGILDVYYFGYLFENQADYLGFYANLSLGGGFSRRGMQKLTAGDGNNLPKKEVLHAKFIVTHHFDNTFPTGKDFRAYFQAEEKIPKHSPPFSYDSNLEKNYLGKVKQPY